MGLILTYKNQFGNVKMYGSARGDIRIRRAEGLGIAENEYITAMYTGQNGQQTLSERALPRCITLALEISGSNASVKLREALKVLSRSGVLYIEDGDFCRRICCHQVQIPDAEGILKNQIVAFAVQFICDSPYFEDKEDTVLSLYGRYKRLATPFTLPCKFGEIIAGAEIENDGDIEIEPIITVSYPVAIANAENVTISNLTTGKSICLDYAPQEGDTVIIDVKNRSITSSKTGNLLNYISIGTFLGDFVLERGTNHISVALGDVTEGFAVECRYSRLYQEALTV